MSLTEARQHQDECLIKLVSGGLLVRVLPVLRHLAGCSTMRCTKSEARAESLLPSTEYCFLGSSFSE